MFYIFGAFVKTRVVHIKLGELKRNEFEVVEQNQQTGELKERLLAQYSSAFYKQKDEKNVGESFFLAKKKDILFMKNMSH